MKISAFIPYENDEQVAQTIASLQGSNLIGKIFLLATKQASTCIS